jgi:hypothetical protein
MSVIMGRRASCPLNTNASYPGIAPDGGEQILWSRWNQLMDGTLANFRISSKWNHGGDTFVLAWRGRRRIGRSDISKGNQLVG